MPSGKKTFINGPHDSVVGELLVQITLDEKHQRAIEKLIDSKLSPDQCAYLSDRLTTLRGLIDAGKDWPALQDARTTLNTLTTIDDDHALRAYMDSDAQTQCFIARGLYLNGEFKPRFADVKPDEIRRAAIRALDGLEKGKQGRTTAPWHPYFAEFARQAWLHLGQHDFKIWRNDNGKDSTFVEFTTQLLSAMNCSRSTSDVEKILRLHIAI
ncbi:MAG: hypothetical protein ABI583_03935 [Betaproteobacteria bacterium]